MIPRDEIIRMARETGAPDWWLGIGLGGEVSGPALQWAKRFAAMVEARAAAAERQILMDMLGAEIGHAQVNGLRLQPSLGRVIGDPGIRLDAIEAVLEAIRARGAA